MIAATFQTCELTILDDELNPQVEGVETFAVFLSSAVSSNLVQPFIATIQIDDTWQDGKGLSLSFCIAMAQSLTFCYKDQFSIHCKPSLHFISRSVIVTSVLRYQGHIIPFQGQSF